MFFLGIALILIGYLLVSESNNCKKDIALLRCRMIFLRHPALIDVAYLLGYILIILGIIIFVPFNVLGLVIGILIIYFVIAFLVSRSRKKVLKKMYYDIISLKPNENKSKLLEFVILKFYEKGGTKITEEFITNYKSYINLDEYDLDFIIDKAIEYEDKVRSKSI